MEGRQWVAGAAGVGSGADCLGWKPCSVKAPSSFHFLYKIRMIGIAPSGVAVRIK